MRKLQFPAIPVIVLLCIISRIPQLASQFLVLDGDESIVALMAKHLHDGRDVAFYFYGQQYGLSIVETSIISVFYSLFGVSDIPVKCAMLFTWTCGIVLYYKAFLNVTNNNKAASFFAVLLFICSPAWAVWSMKARGGYLTAFLLTSAVLFIVTHSVYAAKKVVWLITGLLAVIIFESQPIFLPGLLPVVAWALIRQRKMSLAVFTLAGIGVGVMLFKLFIKPTSDFYNPGSFDIDLGELLPISTFPDFVFTHLKGYYYLRYASPASGSATLFAALFVGILLAVIVAGIYFLLKHPRRSGLYLATIAGILGTLGYCLLRSSDSYRYLLPLTGIVLFAFAMLIRELDNQKVYSAAIVTVAVLGALSMVSFREYKFNPTTRTALKSAIHSLQENGIHYCYSGSLLQWQVTFYSQEKIICRFMSPKDRYQPYIHEADSALSTSSSGIALMNFYDAAQYPAADSFYEAGGYSIKLHTSKETLKKYGYNFSD